MSEKAWWRIGWWLAYPATTLLAVRLVVEQTYFTWRYGPQMVGFALAHGPLMVLLPLVLLGYLWLLGSLVLFVVMWIRGLPITSGARLRAILLAGSVGLIHMPYSVWKLTVVHVFGPGPHQTELLIEAAANGEVRLLEHLLRRGIAVNTRDRDGDTALKGAATAGQVGIVRMLVSAGAELDVQGGPLGHTALMSAAAMGRDQVVVYLLEQGADATVRGNDGHTALSLARRYAHAEIVRMLESTERTRPEPDR